MWMIFWIAFARAEWVCERVQDKPAMEACRTEWWSYVVARKSELRDFEARQALLPTLIGGAEIDIRSAQQARQETEIRLEGTTSRLGANRQALEAFERARALQESEARDL